MENKVIEFAKDYCDFSNPNHVWLMKGISRSKDNAGDYHKFFRRMVLTCPDDISECYDEIKRLSICGKTVYRIYLSLNSRDVVKAAGNMTKNLIDMILTIDQQDSQTKVKKISSEWKTELEQRRNRGTKRVLIDIDDPLVIGSVKSFVFSEMDTKVYASIPTPNGWAMSIDACDTRLLEANFKNSIDIHRDSMIFLEQYKSGS